MEKGWWARRCIEHVDNLPVLTAPLPTLQAAMQNKMQDKVQDKLTETLYQPAQCTTD
jgi:hypothetical protein